MIKIILYAVVVLSILLIVIAVAVANSKNKKLNKTAEVLRELLPNLDCGSCGRKNCAELAEDLAKGKTTLASCPYLVGKNYLKCRQVIKKERKVRFDSN